MDNASAQAFADAWITAWNTRDLDAVLAHYAEDVVFTSPMASFLLEGSDGVIRGSTALRDYWSQALDRIPDLRFELIDFYVGVDTLVLNYRNQAGRLVCEVLQFEGELVSAGHGTYAGPGANPAGARERA